jgi:enoyl-CoA hydratase/carnithine racemase
MPFAHPAWKNVEVKQQDEVTELRFHTDDGPLIWTADAHRELYEAFYWLSADVSTKVIIMSGTGNEYCAVLDTSSFAAMEWQELWWEGQRMLTCLHEIDVPIISIVNGPATIHAEIPVMADIVLAAPHAEFGDRAHFAIRDTVPGDGANLVWTDLLGPTRAKYYLLTGATITADEAQRIGFVNEILALPDLRPRAWALARELSCRSLPVLRYAKAALSIGVRPNFKQNLSHSLAVEGSAHWTLGGIKPGRFSGARTD